MNDTLKSSGKEGDVRGGGGRGLDNRKGYGVIWGGGGYFVFQLSVEWIQTL